MHSLQTLGTTPTCRLPSGTIGSIFFWVIPFLSIQGPVQFYFSGAKEQYQPLMELGSVAAEVIAAEAKQVTITIPGNSTDAEYLLNTCVGGSNRWEWEKGWGGDFCLF